MLRRCTLLLCLFVSLSLSHSLSLYSVVFSAWSCRYYHWYADFFFAFFSELKTAGALVDLANHIVPSMQRKEFLPLFSLVTRFCPREVHELPPQTCFCTDVPNGPTAPEMQHATFTTERFMQQRLGLLNVRRPITELPPRLCVVARARKRFILNELQLLRMAAAQDVIPSRLPLEEMTIYEQLRELQLCTLLVGVHGSGLVNMIFLQPGSSVMQILPWNVDPAVGPKVFRALAERAHVAYRQWVNPSWENAVLHWHFAPPSVTKFKPELAPPPAGISGNFFAFWVNQDTVVPAAVFQEWIDLTKAIAAGTAPSVPTSQPVVAPDSRKRPRPGRSDART